MKLYITIIALCLSVYASAQIDNRWLYLNVKQSVDYPKIYDGYDKKSLSDALLFIVNSRNNIPNFEVVDKNLARFRFKMNLENRIKALKQMRSEIMLVEGYYENGLEVMQAMTNLKDKSRLIIEHIDKYAPWPLLDELKSVPATITDIMPGCCSYVYWYNDYLFIIANLYEITRPGSDYIKMRIDITDRSAYKEYFERGRAKTVPFDSIQNQLLYNRDNIKDNIESVIGLIDRYYPKLKEKNNPIKQIAEKNREIYEKEVVEVGKIIEEELEKTERWLDSVEVVSKALQDSVLLYNDLIAQYSAEYYSLKRNILSNENKINGWQVVVDQLGNQELEMLGKVDSLRVIIDDLLSDCKGDIANDDCVKDANKLKKTNLVLQGVFEEFEQISNQKITYSDSIIMLSEQNAEMSILAQTAYDNFVLKRNQYQPIATAHLEHKEAIKDSLSFQTSYLYRLNKLKSDYEVAIGLKEDPFLEELRRAARLGPYKPIPNLPDSPIPIDPTDPDNPWNPGWIDPIRNDLLKNIIEKKGNE